MKFIEPLMPTLVEKPPEGDGWNHEVKFDGYRSQIVKDETGVRIFTRRRLDWTAKYRDLGKPASDIDVESAIIEGEVIALNDAGCRTSARCGKQSSRQHDLYFDAFDLQHVNGHDLRDTAAGGPRIPFTNAFRFSASKFVPSTRRSEHGPGRPTRSC
ncbi:hypothetical protein [Mesorhizobium sp. ES1-4]|uniref:ATP-dependent DNA ligase n=1 Tax=Mesorhizobium sp. ES1-4 TaxID=2876627 RepID=UPI001CCFE141|nr:hypothetical protein [Mesorhizobium sp. ES1-4]MBZ9799430.1 hypothetical protein [Mesorhizobium sp. ES1-4]